MLPQELALGSSGSRLARRKALGLGGGGAEGRRRHRVVAGGMADDGSYVGPGGAGAYCLLGLRFMLMHFWRQLRGPWKCAHLFTCFLLNYHA